MLAAPVRPRTGGQTLPMMRRITVRRVDPAASRTAVSSLSRRYPAASTSSDERPAVGGRAPDGPLDLCRIAAQRLGGGHREHDLARLRRQQRAVGPRGQVLQHDPAVGDHGRRFLAQVGVYRAAVRELDDAVEGRDIGTVVAPAAGLKVYLTADPSARAARRSAELTASHQRDLASVEESLRRRDKYDSTRATAPLAAADDAVVLDSTDLTLDEVVTSIVTLARSRVSASEVSR